MSDRVKLLMELLETIQNDLDAKNIEPEAAAEIWSIGIKDYLIFKRPLTAEQIAVKGITVQNLSELERKKW